MTARGSQAPHLTVFVLRGGRGGGRIAPQAKYHSLRLARLSTRMQGKKGGLKILLVSYGR